MQFKSILFVYFLTLLSCAFAIQDEDVDNDSYIDVHQHPKNGFSCEGKKVGEYYSDLTTNCQLYYVCLPNAQLKLSPTSFACPNTTRFNQATRVCSPADQVYCNIAERYYENIHGSIDSKDQRPNEYLTPDFDKTPWQINRQKASGKALIVPLNLEPEYKVQPERPRPSPRTLPKIDQSQSLPKSDSPLHTSFALTFNNAQAPRVVARTRTNPINTNTRRANTVDILPNSLSQPSNRFKSSNIQNSRSRTPVSPTGGRNSVTSTIATTSTTTTTTTTTPAPPSSDSPKDSKSSDYIYDYVEYDAPAAANQPNTQPTNLKPPPLPALPALDREVQPNRNTNTVSTTNSNIGSLFSGAINHQQPPRISQPSTQSNSPRPPQRNQLPQTSSLNYFNSNPFASNPFSSNPFSSNSPSHIRQKRDVELIEVNEPKKASHDQDDVVFSCTDKLPGIGYADVGQKCMMFHICLPLSKGKFKDYQLFCESGQAFNQFSSNCEPIDKFDCKRSKDYYLYNKQINLHSYLKNKSRITKQLADIKN